MGLRARKPLKASVRNAVPPPPAETVTIRQSEFIPATPSAVYDAFLNPKTHEAITGAGAVFERREGGKFSVGDGYITGKFLRLQNSRRIVQEWKTTEWPVNAPPSVLELRFMPKENGTEISLVQTQVPANQAMRYRRGWTEHYWTPLKKYFNKDR